MSRFAVASESFPTLRISWNTLIPTSDGTRRFLTRWQVDPKYARTSDQRRRYRVYKWFHVDDREKSEGLQMVGFMLDFPGQKRAIMSP